MWLTSGQPQQEGITLASRQAGKRFLHWYAGRGRVWRARLSASLYEVGIQGEKLHECGQRSREVLQAGRHRRLNLFINAGQFGGSQPSEIERPKVAGQDI